MAGRLGMAGLALAPVLVLAGAPAALAAETRGEALLARWVAEAEAGGSTVSVATRDYDAVRDRVEWRDVTIADKAEPRRVLTLKAARFEGLLERDGSYAATRIELDGLALGDKDSTMKIGAVALSDAFLPNFQGLALPDKPALADVLKAIDAVKPLKLKAGEIRDVVLDLPNTSADAQPGERLAFGFGRVAVEGLGDGVLGRFMLGRITGSGTDKGKPIQFGFEEARLERLDLAALADFLTRARYPDGRGDGVWRDVVGTYAVAGVTIEAAGLSMKIGRYGIDNLALRRVGTGFLDLVEAGPGADEATIMRGMFSALDSVRLGRYGLDGIALAFEAPDASGTVQRGRMALETVEVKDLALAGLGAYRIGGVSLAVDDVVVALKEFVIGDVLFPTPDAIAAAVAAAAAGEEPRPVTLMPLIGTVRLAGLGVEQPGAARIALERAELRQTGTAGALPTSLGLDIVGLTLPADLPDPDWRDIMRGSGRDALTLGAKLGLHYDPKAATLSLDDLSVVVDGDGRVGVSAVMTGIAPELYAAPEKAEDYLGEMGVGGGRVVVEDRGLSDWILTVAGQRLGVPAEDLRRVAVERLPQVVAPIQDAGRRAAVRKALERFLQPPATLTIAAKPTEAVPLLQVVATVAANPWRLLDILAVEVTASP